MITLTYETPILGEYSMLKNRWTLLALMCSLALLASACVENDRELAERHYGLKNGTSYALVVDDRDDVRAPGTVHAKPLAYPEQDNVLVTVTPMHVGEDEATPRSAQVSVWIPRAHVTVVTTQASPAAIFTFSEKENGRRTLENAVLASTVLFKVTSVQRNALGLETP